MIKIRRDRSELNKKIKIEDHAFLSEFLKKFQSYLFYDKINLI